MDTEKAVVILLVISILFSAMAVIMNFAVISGTEFTPMIGGGTNTNIINKITNSGPAGGVIGLNVVGGP